MAFSTAGGGSSSPRPTMNVTPLIDVLLVLIIVFMIVVIEQRPTGLETQLPQQAKSKSKDPSIPPPDATIVIRIHHAQPRANLSPAELALGDHPQVMVNKEAVDWNRLPDRLRDIFSIRITRIAYLEADDDVDFQDVAEVIAIAKFAGVDRVGLLTEDGKHLPV
jgi:biopolymer transport protein ExbD